VIVGGILAAATLVWSAGPARAQSRTGSTGGLGGSSGGSGGGPSGGLGSVPGLSSTGFGTALGGTSTSGRTGTGTSGTQTYGSNTGYGPYYANPLAVGYPNTTGSSQTASLASQYQRAYPIQLSFGQAIAGTATVSRSGTTTPGIGTAVSGFGVTGSGTTGSTGTGTVTNNIFGGANTAGIIRTPRFITEPVFDRTPLPSGLALQGDLQSIIARSGRLASRGDIRVSVDGRTVVLTGRVRNERERRLAEALVRLTPGVREVKNNLTPQSTTGLPGAAASAR
jgi:hypothetical protein